MNDSEKILVYELHIEDMLNALSERYSELCNRVNLSEFDQGRQLAYFEMLEIINTRHSIIKEILFPNSRQH